MNKDGWRQLEITPEQQNAKRLDSVAHGLAGAVEQAREEAKERAARFMPVGCDEEKLTAAQAQQAAEIMEREYHNGYRYSDRRKAAKLLAETFKHRIVLGDEFERYLRAMSGWRQKDDIPPQEPEPYEQHAMGFQEQ